MEILLNLVWSLMGATLALLWFCSVLTGRTGSPITPLAGRRTQLLALLLVLLILFPVISLSDDRMAATQNPAETDCSLRKGSDSNNTQQLLPASTEPEVGPMISLIDPSLLIEMSTPLKRAIQNPALRRVDNRPPPSL